MKAESAAFLQQAQIILGRAKRMIEAGLYEDAARCAYLACFHVAQGLIFEQTERVFKSHNGVQAEFHRLIKGQAGVDDTLRKFLSQAYEFKSAADYGTGPDAVVSAAEAEAAVVTGTRFVAHFSEIVVSLASGLAPSPRSRSSI